MSRPPDDETSFFIDLARVCSQLQCLPGPGGVLEQDGYIMMGVRAALDAFEEKADRDKPKVPRMPRQ